MASTDTSTSDSRVLAAPNANGDISMDLAVIKTVQDVRQQQVARILTLGLSELDAETSRLIPWH
jgi:hypothetical protein